MESKGNNNGQLREQQWKVKGTIMESKGIMES
jgi:hypothetical protein